MTSKSLQELATVYQQVKKHVLTRRACFWLHHWSAKVVSLYKRCTLDLAMSYSKHHHGRVIWTSLGKAAAHWLQVIRYFHQTLTPGSRTQSIENTVHLIFDRIDIRITWKECYAHGTCCTRLMICQYPWQWHLTSTAATLLRGRIWDISGVCRVHKKVGRYLRMTLSPMLVSQRCRRMAHGAQESVVTLKTLCVSCHLNTLHGTKGPLNNGCQTTFLGHRIPRPVSLSML